MATTEQTANEELCESCSKPSLSHCKACRTTYYCSTDCQKRNWSVHKTYCKFLQKFPRNSEPQSISCAKIHSSNVRYEDVSVPSNYAMFRTRALPITAKFGYPLVMSRLVENLPLGQDTENHHATWLNIDPESGFAPPHWQGGIGTVLVAAADGSPFDTETLGAITDYIGIILDNFGGGGVPRWAYNKAKLDNYIEQHKRGIY